MKRLFHSLFLTTLILTGSVHSLSAAAVASYSFSFDEHGNGFETYYSGFTGSTTRLQYEIVPDPTHGITNAPVLIYLIPDLDLFLANEGDVEMVSTDGSNTVSHLIRFIGMAPPPNLGGGGGLIFYASDHTGALADVGVPPSNNPVQISDNGPAGVLYYPTASDPGGSLLLPYVSYKFFTEPVYPPYVLSTNRLSIARTGTGGIMFSWYTNATNFALYQGTNQFRTNWVPVTNTPFIANDQNRVIIPGPLTGTRFFRLIAQ